MSINLDKIRLYCILHHITDAVKIPWCGNCKNYCQEIKATVFYCDYEGDEEGEKRLLVNTFTLEQPMGKYDIYCGFYNFNGCDDCVPKE